MAYTVFISHTKRDSGLARDLAQRLEQVGVKAIWTEEKVKAGEDWESRINRDLQASDEVIVFLTENSINRAWVMYEMGAAFGMHKRITPIVVGLTGKELPQVVKGLSYINYAEVSNYVSKLGERAGDNKRVHAQSG